MIVPAAPSPVTDEGSDVDDAPPPPRVGPQLALAIRACVGLAQYRRTRPISKNSNHKN